MLSGTLIVSWCAHIMKSVNGQKRSGAVAEPVKPWFVYLLECRGGRLYAGVTLDLAARMRKHRMGTGAKFTRGHPPQSLLAAKPFPSRSATLSMEVAVKKMTAAKKRVMVTTWALEFEIGDDVHAVFAQSDDGMI